MENLLKLLFEAGVLTRMKRTGPFHVGMTTHETIAAHCYRHMLLAYFLAQEEAADAGKVLKMGLVADLPETRTLDLTFLEKRYVTANEAAALADQRRGVKGAEEPQQLGEEYKKKETIEAKVARDADMLEALIEAKEFMQQ